jgi:Protein of unknown function (DUF1800)
MRLLALLLAVIASTRGWAQAPPEVHKVRFPGAASLAWTPASGAVSYNVYRGTLSDLAAGIPARCHLYRNTVKSISAVAPSDATGGYYYLITGESAAGEEGTAGVDSRGVERPLLGRCGPVLRNNALDRTGYGWSEWSRDRIAALGSVDAYVNEQLDPSSISEADNTDLTSRFTAIEPPKNSTDLIARQVVGGVYARRQLAEQVGNFWTNHFNTDNRKVGLSLDGQYPNCSSPGVPPQCDASFPTRANQETALLQKREFDAFQNLSFAGTFRQMLGASAKSPAMIIFLDTLTNVVSAPNENYAREILELHSMGVDGGYTQTDVEQLAKVFTGWNYCRKAPADETDPLAPCITNYWDTSIAGDWVANFLPAKHDCNQKILFQGTPQRVVIGPTCANTSTQVQELDTALDAIAAHPSTARFISKEILEKFVTDSPETAQIDALVLAWNNRSNPHGIGDLRAVLRAALTSPAFSDPDQVRSKIKTPLEQFVSAFRAIRGKTNGSAQVFNYLTQASHLPYLDAVPTGWPEDGNSWLDTNNTLTRQNFGIQLASSTSANFGSDPLGLLVANGVPTASGNAAAVVDFFADVLFAGALTPAERQSAIDFLNVDDDGVPAPYTNARIKDLVGFLLGFPQFQEQ